jgi:hypothetical protein
MNEGSSSIVESGLAYFDSAVNFVGIWDIRAQNEQLLQQVLLAFLVATTLGWFIHSFIARKNPANNISSTSNKSAIRKKDGRTKEDVELRARRRL